MIYAITIPLSVSNNPCIGEIDVAVDVHLIHDINNEPDYNVSEFYTRLYDSKDLDSKSDINVDGTFYRRLKNMDSFDLEIMRKIEDYLSLDTDLLSALIEDFEYSL